MKIKIVHTPKDIRMEWMKKIQGLSGQQTDESQGRGREDHKRASLSWADNNSINHCPLNHQPVLHTKCLLPMLLFLLLLLFPSPRTSTTPRQRASNSTKPSSTRRMPAAPVTILVVPTQQWKTSTMPSSLADVHRGPLTLSSCKTSLLQDPLLLVVISSACPWYPTMWHRWNAAHKSGTSMTTRGLDWRLLTPVDNWSEWWVWGCTTPWWMFRWR